MVSIIVPTYNRKQYLGAALGSVLKQSFQDWELLVVDDGSSDETRTLVKEWADPRIRYLFQKNQGVSQARNAGIRLARYPWISFLDSDDLWHTRKLQRQIEELETHPAFKVIYTDEIWIRRGRRVNPKKKHQKFGGWIFRHCLPLCIISPSSILIHRDILLEVGLFDPLLPVCEDYDLWLRIAATYPIYYLNERLITKVGGHPDQLSKSRWGLDAYRVRSLKKLYSSGRLTYQQQLWTAAEIAQKSTVLATGFANRAKDNEAAAYRETSQRWLKKSVLGPQTVSTPKQTRC